MVGLGNPGRRYVRSRHNIGVRVVERFAADCGFSLSESDCGGRLGRGMLATGAADGSIPVAALVPETFMNRSGESVLQALGELDIADCASDLVIVFDDVDLAFGRLRIRPRGSSGGHRGLRDVIDRLGHGNFPRLRFGIGRPASGNASTADWVLEDFSESEESSLRSDVPLAAEALAAIVRDGVTAAMNRYNRGPDLPGPDPEGERPGTDSSDDAGN